VTFVAAARTWLACAFRRFASLFCWGRFFPWRCGGGWQSSGAKRAARTIFAVCRNNIREIPLSTFGRRFRLSDERAGGVSCDLTGVFVGGVPLLEPCRNCAGFQKWRLRPMDELNHDLSKRYGVPVEFDAKLEALAAIARALDRSDLLHAHIATLHLQIPDPPPLTKIAQSASEMVALAKQLHFSGLLKRGWDPAKHPRWPAASPDSVGGRFAPGDAAPDTGQIYDSNASIRTAQALPIPFEAVTPRGAIPWPSEIAPPIGVLPRSRLENPYPDRDGCDEEWEYAREYCRDLDDRGLLGKGDYWEHGKVFLQCVLGQVSERCGGSPHA
jgi:hypothetical protein